LRRAADKGSIFYEAAEDLKAAISMAAFQSNIFQSKIDNALLDNALHSLQHYKTFIGEW